ncbi:hypothetical protein QA640_17150 [Bradyrhizobium sp. CB82]|nr:hypothetical protein [Bradyrhizobium sp. CB82]WFU44018.1 hypothetical protein QA640_17150 [Bradyrhizobium sp. CB82]
MEPETKDPPAKDAKKVEQDIRERQETTLPFASEGLEQLRDSHC